jgi:hypothetical protein
LQSSVLRCEVDTTACGLLAAGRLLEIARRKVPRIQYRHHAVRRPDDEFVRFPDETALLFCTHTGDLPIGFPRVSNGRDATRGTIAETQDATSTLIWVQSSMSGRKASQLQVALHIMYT